MYLKYMSSDVYDKLYRQGYTYERNQFYSGVSIREMVIVLRDKRSCNEQNNCSSISQDPLLQQQTQEWPESL